VTTLAESMKKKLFVLVTLLLMFFVAYFYINKDISKKQNINHEYSYIKSAHYFSSAWPKTFWQEFEQGDVEAELKQIKADGFNTIVLTVPWRGFETDFQSKTTTSIPALYDRLESMLNAIVKQDLLFMLRVGFPHDYSPDTGTDGMQQCLGLYTNEKMQQHWLDYLNKVKQVVNPFQSASAGILISWEDHWCPHFVFPQQSPEDRLTNAQLMGYGEWLKSKETNVLKVLLGQNDLDYSKIRVPQKHEPSYVYYLEFIDHILDQKILKPTQSVFSNAALEIRVDKDPVKQGDDYIWIGHDLYLDDPNHRGTYWAPFWGANNQGELLTAEQALKNFEYFLKYISADGYNSNHVIEQFNFTDNTPYFPNNANIVPIEINQFLLRSAPLLKQYTAGVGVWTYKDYVDNAFYNGSFEMGIAGWEVEGQAQIQSSSDDNTLLMAPQSTVTQSFIAAERFILISEYQELNLCLNAANPAEIQIIVDNQLIKEWSLSVGLNCTQIPASPFNKPEATQFSLTASTDANIDELKIYGFTQHLGLYDAQGNQGPYLETYRQFNELLTE
jgi:hypothetical protein